MPSINTEEWLAELDSLAADTAILRPVVDDRGFTIYDLMKRHNVRREKARRIINDLMRQGVIRKIGFRSGCGSVKVYERIANSLISAP